MHEPHETPLARPGEGWEEGQRAKVNAPVFAGSAVGALLVTAWALIAPTHAEATLATMVGYVSDWFGWFYVALATAILVFVVHVAASRYGRVRLGPEHARPEYSTLSWASMLFAAGIGTDLMFFAVNEPVVQYLTPPSGEGETVEAAREATAWTMFHYGISGSGMYALMGMALGYFAYRMNLPLAVRSALYPLIGRRIEGAVGHVVDTAAVLGTIFGVATSLGIGVVGLNVGLGMLFGLPQGLSVQLALLVLAVGMATVSAVSGIDKGIKRMSQLNVLLAVGLALWVLVTGKTSYLLNAAVLNIGDYVRLFPDMTMQTFAYDDTGSWMSFWTLFFWAWWIAWASFVGLFLARISRGRTIRQFVAGTLMANLSSRLRTVNDDGAPNLRIFWALATGALTLAILSVGGIYALQYATVIMGLPFAVVLVLVMVGLYKALRVEGFRAESAKHSIRGMLSGRTTHREPTPPLTWRQRLTRAMDFPSVAEAQEYLEEVALPALDDVAAELRARDVAATASRIADGQTSYVELVADIGAEHPFQYQMWTREVPMPVYGRSSPRGHDVYARLEVHLREGGQGYDVMGYTHTQLIDDVLDQYERHLEFLHLQQQTTPTL